ncbi:MAG TPA: ABC transporter permease [Pyrinomonadaceae bacterium]|jgi:predicted permease|nr:ABC transporter permease [Pyrinomonadaceae bacterium]
MLKDLRYAIRMLTKTPGVTCVAIVTLALGIGANTAIFSGVSAFILRDMPVPEANRLVRPVEMGEDGGRVDEISYPDFVEYRNQSTSFTGLAAEDMLQVAIDTQDQNDVIWGQAVSGNYFDVMQVKPLMGRAFLPEEDGAPGAHPVVVLGHSLWERRLGSDPNIVGKKLRLNNRPYEVIGVAPKFFKGSKFGLSMDFWVPIAMVEELRGVTDWLKSRNSHWMNVIGRLKPGVSLAQATAEVNAISSRLNQIYPDDRASTTHAKVLTEADGRWGNAGVVFKSGSGVAMAIVGLVLLIACANVANLLLARAAARRKEIGIRIALGASRSRLIRQLLTESLLLSLAGGGLGLLLAYWITHLMEGFIPILQYNIIENFFDLDSRALLFTFVVAVASGLVFGLAPAWNSSNPDIVPILKGGSDVRQRKTRRLTLRNTLVVAQVALSLTVLVCGGLFIKSFRRAQQMDPGFETRNALLATLNPQLVGYDNERARNFYEQAVARVSSIPGISGAGVARLIPLGDSSNSTGPVLKEGEVLQRGSTGRNIGTNVVSAGYFNALRIDFLDGRNFDERDKLNAQKVVVINQHMAEQLWPDESALGKRIFIGTDDHEGIEVVGVVKTGRYRNLAEDPRSFMYFPVTQRRPGIMTLVARTNGDPRNFVGAIRHEMQMLDRTVPLSSVRTMPEHMTWPLWAPNMAASLSLGFGLVALLLSSVGLYSVMAYVVSQRTKEVGIRMALGASRKDVLQMITSQGMRLALIGAAIGLALALALAKVVSSLLIGISGYDVTTFVVVFGLLGVVAFVASLLPARRATKVDPLVALRYE